MSESEKLAGVQGARKKFDEVLRAMERFIMNLDPGRGQALRDWLRFADADGRADALPAPPLDGWPLADRIGEHAANVLAARAAWREARRLRRPAE
jgi:hypothetical protein